MDSKNQLSLNHQSLFLPFNATPCPFAYPLPSFRHILAQISVEGRKHGSDKVMRSKLHLVRVEKTLVVSQSSG